MIPRKTRPPKNPPAPPTEYRDPLPITRHHAAGIDVGDATHWVCVGSAADGVREFPTHTPGLRDLVDWLRQRGVSTVALEASGAYGHVLFLTLVEAGFQTVMTSPAFTRQIQGRPKTDRLDCQWIQRLHAHGLLPSVFQPDDATQTLRSFVRQRGNLVRLSGQHIQRMQKALVLMNLKLTKVLGDITGRHRAQDSAGDSGRRTGSRGAGQAARPALPEERTGDRHGARRPLPAGAPERIAVVPIDVGEVPRGDRHARRRDRRALGDHAASVEFAAVGGQDAGCAVGSRTIRSFDVRSALYYATGVDLTAIEGIDELHALTLVSELGPNFTKWPTGKHFASWLGLCPQFKKTGGKVQSSRTRLGKNRAAIALRLAAWSLIRSKSYLGAYLRRQRSRLGAPKAITATAHKLARILYNMMRYGVAYAKKEESQYADEVKQKLEKSFHRRAKELGYEVKKIETPDAIEAPVEQT